MKKLFILGLALGFLLIGKESVAGQRGLQEVSLTITVTDATGYPIPRAQVKLQPQALVAPKIPEADEKGQILLKALPGGYDLFVTAATFGFWTKSIRVEQKTNQMISVTLEIACKRSLV